MCSEKKSLVIGLALLASFGTIFCILMSPVFPGANGAKVSGLRYADDIFNELSKGSSYFIPAVRESIKAMPNSEINLTVKIASPQLVEPAVQAIEKAGLQKKEVSGTSISFCGSLADLLLSATVDSDCLYRNDGEAVSQKYNCNEPLILAEAWWDLLTPTVKALQMQHRIGEAKIVDLVIRKAIEPGNNYYGIPAMKVSDHIMLVTALLAFYVLYSLWYGFSIYYIFEGLGLMKNVGKKH